jgi:[ribosomal protein S5]-alanine N-acetyltransferase
MDKMLLEIPQHFETDRLALRAYQVGDGAWYDSVCQRNKNHLAYFEKDNPIHTVQNEKDAEILVRQFAADWTARNHFFLAVFEKHTHDFIGQIYIGVVNWDLPEFEVGYFADAEFEGRGYISEAVRGTLEFIFKYFKAVRVRLECDDSNQRSLRVAERCGFKKEGHIRQNKRREGGILTGTLFYGMLREEYEAIIHPM